MFRRKRAFQSPPLRKGNAREFFFIVTKIRQSSFLYERSTGELPSHTQRGKKSLEDIRASLAKKRRKKRDVSNAFATFASILSGKNSLKRKHSARLFRWFRFFPRRRIDARRKSRVKRDTFFQNLSPRFFEKGGFLKEREQKKT